MKWWETAKSLLSGRDLITCDECQKQVWFNEKGRKRHTFVLDRDIEVSETKDLINLWRRGHVKFLCEECYDPKNPGSSVSWIGRFSLGKEAEEEMMKKGLGI